MEEKTVNERKPFVQPEIKVIKLEVEDVITTSLDLDEGPGGLPIITG